MNDHSTPDQRKQPFPQKVISKIGFNQRFFWIGTWFLIGFAIALIPIFYASSTKKVLFPPAFLWACAYLLLGALLGFVFGIPKIISNSSYTPTPVPLPPNPTESEKQALEKGKRIIEANTNLTQISDWFTKVVVGAGLVEMKQIPTFIKDIATKMAKGLAASELPENISFAAVFSGGIIVLFSVFGFIFGYIIMRIILTELFADQ